MKREEHYPSFAPGVHMSTDQWVCTCGQWRKASEKCIHLINVDGSLADFRSETIN